MKSIYEIYVPVTSQEQADRLKAICLEYGLPIWEDECAFEVDSFRFLLFENEVFLFEFIDGEFFIVINKGSTKTPITESEFLLLAKEFKTQ
jgi:hypothetical protein